MKARDVLEAERTSAKDVCLVGRALLLVRQLFVGSLMYVASVVDKYVNPAVHCDRLSDHRIDPRRRFAHIKRERICPGCDKARKTCGSIAPTGRDHAVPSFKRNCRTDRLSAGRMV